MGDQAFALQHAIIISLGKKPLFPALSVTSTPILLPNRTRSPRIRSGSSLFSYQEDHSSTFASVPFCRKPSP